MTVGLLGFLAVLFLPGSWVAFGPGLGRPGFLQRGLLAAALSPALVFAQFLLLRGLGAGFEACCVWLVVLNLPALALVWRRRDEAGRLEPRVAAAALLVLLVPLLLLAPQALDPQVRAFTAHTWTHTDLVYRLAAGDLHPGEPELAGLRVGYSFSLHVQQAVASWWLGAPPASSYFWTNFVWMLVSAGFAAELAGALGGGRLARWTAPLWMFFGVNAVGYSLHRALPSEWADAWYVWGDYRHAPFFIKYFFFNQVPVAVGVCLGIALLAARSWPRGLGGIPLAVAGLLVASMGLLYPILLPSALAILGVRAGLDLWQALRAGDAPWLRLVGLAASVAVAGAVTLAFLHVVGRDRTMGTAVLLSTPRELLRKSVEIAIVLSPLLAGLAFSFRRCLGLRPEATWVLALGGLGSAVAYVLFHIPHYRNEYKFVFGAALCLAPFAAVACEPVLKRAGRGAPVLVLALAGLLGAPFAERLAREWPWVPAERPRVDLASFDLRLAPGEPRARLFDAIREGTPVDAVVVLEVDRLHYPTLTQRQLYVPPVRDVVLPGVGTRSENVLRRVRAYPPAVLDERRAVVRRLFETNAPSERTSALEALRGLGRPLVIVVEQPERSDLARWLVGPAGGATLFEADDVVVVQVDP